MIMEDMNPRRLTSHILTSTFFVGLFLFCMQPAHAGVVYFSDQFDVSVQTELSSRTPDVGTSWSQLIDNGRNLYVQTYNDWITTQSNGSNVGTLYQTNGTYSSADYQITGRSAFSGGDSNYTRSYAVRIQDANNMYLARFGSGASGIIIYKRTSGTWTQLGSTSYTPVSDLSAPYNDAGDVIGIRAEGTNISALVNGSVVLTVSDSDHTSAGTAGVGTGYVNVSTDDSGTGVGIDNIIVEDLTDTTDPTVSSLNPADDATNVGVDATFEINFSEDIVTSTGNIILYQASDDSIVETIDVTDAAGIVTASSTTALIINPSTTLDSETAYYFTIDATVVDDTSGNSFAGISNSTTWNFTTADVINPTVSSLNPADNATGVAVDANFEINFSEDVSTSTGNIIFYKASDDSVVETIDITNAAGLVTASSTSGLIINPTTTLDSATEYYITIGATVVDDSSGNSFAGISNSTTWSFTTIDTVAPTISGASPSGEQSAGSNTVNFSVSTDENATCKYSTTSGSSFASMTAFSTTGGSSHSASVSVNDGSSYTYYVLCQDASSNESSETTLSFSIATAVTNGSVLILPAPINGPGGSDHFVNMGTHKYIGTLPADIVNIATYLHSPITFDIPALRNGVPTSQSHRLEIIDMDLLHMDITIEIQSDPQIAKLALGEKIAIDLDDDGLYDIDIHFFDIVRNRAELTISRIDNSTKETHIPTQTPRENQEQIQEIQPSREDEAKTSATPVDEAPPAPAERSAYTFIENLEKGSFGQEVKKLQEYLNKHGFLVDTIGSGSPGHETTFFGPLTRKALAKFQETHGLPAYGFFGPMTRAIINPYGHQQIP